MRSLSHVFVLRHFVQTFLNANIAFLFVVISKLSQVRQLHGALVRHATTTGRSSTLDVWQVAMSNMQGDVLRARRAPRRQRACNGD